jgi:hypothetical protein
MVSPRLAGALNVDLLFINTLDELAQRTVMGAPEYDVLMSAGLLRKLLLDGGNSLMDQVNRERRLQLTFAICVSSEFERALRAMTPTAWSLGDGLDPQTTAVDAEVEHVKRDRFLARTVMIANGVEYSVHDVIKTAANVVGAVHAGEGRSERDRLLAEMNRQLSVGGMGAVVQALPAISRVTLQGLEPLRRAVEAHA